MLRLHRENRTGPCTAPPTNLVYLSIGAISNYLHQFEYPSWILKRQKKRGRRNADQIG